jgi:N-acetylglucosamine-6-phosphate deacetylase
MTLSHRSSGIALRHATVIDGERILANQAVMILGDRIEEIIPDQEYSDDRENFDLGHAFVAPGFIDLQLNGAGGVLFNDAINAETLAVMQRTNLRSGTTGFLPTLITTSESNMERALEVVERYRSQGAGGVLGLHLEGPYINPNRKGIHDGTAIRRPSSDLVNSLIVHAKRFPVLLTLAPECNDLEVVRLLSDSGVIVSAGHSDGTYEETVSGFAAGIRVATHLFNAMSPWTGRDPGVVGAILDRPEVAAGIIVDGIHVHYASIRLAKRLKGEGLFLVTDAVTPTGTSMSSFEFGGQTVYVEKGRCVNRNGTLGGTLLTMNQAIANLVRHAGIPLLEAVRMATLYPARVIGREGELGRIASGYLANLAVFDQNFAMRAVVDHGTWLPCQHSA